MATIKQVLARRQREVGRRPSSQRKAGGPSPPRLVPAQLTPEQEAQITEFEAIRARPTQLIDLQEGFNTPAAWAAINQEYMEQLKQAKLEGAQNAPVIGPTYLPVEWVENFRNETRGPRGEKLPSNARGWLPDGRPDFGGGFSGVLKSAWYSVAEKPRGKIDFRKDFGSYGPTATSLRNDLKQRLSETVEEKDVGRAWLGVAGSVLTHGFQYIGDLYAGAEDNETILGKATKLIGAGFQVIGGSFEELGKIVERGPYGQNILAADQLLRMGVEQGALTPEGVEWMDKFRKYGAFSAPLPIAMTWKLRAQGLLEGRKYIAPGLLAELVDYNRDAARMAYTGWFEPASAEEYRRRMQGNEDPRLLAMELENPGAEALGRAIFEPANLLDIFFVGAKVNNLLKVNRGIRELTTIADIKVADAFLDLAKASEAEMPAAAIRVLDTVGDMYAVTREGGVKHAGQRGLLPIERYLTVGGKRAVYGQRVNNFMSTIISTAGDNPDLANSVWHGLALAADPNPNILTSTRARGIGILNQAMVDSKGLLTRDVLFSPSGNETAILLRRLLENDAGDLDTSVLLRMMEKAGDDPQELARLLDRQISKALEKDFPTIQDQTALNVKYEELLKADEAADVGRAPPTTKETIQVDLPTETKATHRVTRVVGKAPSVKADDLSGTVRVSQSPGGGVNEQPVRVLHRAKFAGVSAEDPSYLAFTVPGTKGKVHMFVHVDDLPDSIRAQIASFLPGATEDVIQAPGQAARFLERNPLANKDPGAFYKSLAKADDFFQPVYRRMGDFFSRLFMGMWPNSWRYNAGNRLGNFAPMLVDVGPGPALKGLLHKFPGLPSKWGPQASMDEIARQLGGVLPEGAIRGLGPARSFRGGQAIDVAKGDWVNRITTGGLRFAQEDEAAAAAFTVDKSIQRSMKSYMKAEGRILNKELSMLPPEQRKLVLAEMRRNYYDGDKAFDVLRSDDGYDVARNFAFLNDDEVQELRDLQLYDFSLEAARETDSLDDVLRKIDAFVEHRSQTGMVAGGESPALNMEDIFGQRNAAESFMPPEYENVRAADVFSRRRHEVNEFDRLYDEALFSMTGLQRLAGEQIMRDTLLETARMSENITDEQKAKLVFSQLEGVIGPTQREIGEAIQSTLKSSSAFMDENWARYKQSFGRRTGDKRLATEWMKHDAEAQKFGLPGIGPVPEKLTARKLRDALWQDETSSYHKIQGARWTQHREQNVERYRLAGQKLAAAAGMEDFRTPAVNAAEAQLIRSRQMDSAELAADRTMVVKGAPRASDLQDSFLVQYDNVVRASLEDVARTLPPAEEGKAREFLQRLEGKDPEGVIRVLGDADLDEAARLTAEQLGMDVDEFKVALFDEALQPAIDDVPVVGSMDDAYPTPYRVLHETQPAAVNAAERLKQGLQDNWGQTGRMGALDPDAERAISQYLIGQRGRKTEARAVAISVANQTRDFILHNYPVRYGLDLAAGYAYPYQFWHSRTYLKWMKRMIMHPGMVGAYANYRAALEKEHAGMEPWWRQNINVSDLLGLETDSPLWFNLERSLNPIQGLTGVDFTDPQRRLDQYSATLEDLNKFGPSVWPVYPWLLALKYHVDGEEEAAARWSGRSWGGFGFIKDLTSLIDPKGIGVELDPFIHLFAGGIDPRERGRVGRQLSAMQEEGLYSEAELIDAGRTQSGEIWDIARGRAVNQRAPNLPLILAPYFLGSGFKMRTESDAEIAQFYARYIGLYRMKEDLSKEEYIQARNELASDFPFMDVLLLTKKAGPERDEALAWSVLDRIGPAMTENIAEIVGIDKEILSLFHESKGNLEDMAEADRLKFMSAILEMAAILDVPDNATKAEWETAKALRRQMRTSGEELFGEDIWDRVDAWWAVFDPESRQASEAMAARDPSIQQAMDWEQRMVMTTPLLGAYYTSEERIRKFYNRQMFDAAEEIFGADLWDHLAVQGALFDAGDRKAAFKYRDDHPQLKGWSEFRDQTKLDIEAKVDRLGALLPEAADLIFRDDERQLGDPPEGPPEPSRQDFIDAQVLAYSSGQQKEDAPKDVSLFVRRQADNQWPGTRSAADLYYKRLETNVGVAQKMLMHNSALSARVAWESDALRQLMLVQEGQFAQTGAQTQGVEPPSPSWTEWRQVLSNPLWRLARDHLRYGDTLTEDETLELQDVADGMGVGFDELMGRLREAYQEEEGVSTGGDGAAGLPRSPGGVLALGKDTPISKAIKTFAFGLSSLGHTIRSFFGFTKGQEELAQFIKDEFPGLKPSAIDQARRIVEAPRTLKLFNPGGGVAPPNIDIGQLEILTPALASDVTDRYVVLHEMGHEINEAGPGFGNISGKKDFRDAVFETLTIDPDKTRGKPWSAVWDTMVFHPGILGKEKRPSNVLPGGWGGYNELHAEIFAGAEGYLDNVPPPMRPFFADSMSFAPSQGYLYEPPAKTLSAALAIQTAASFDQVKINQAFTRWAEARAEARFQVPQVLDAIEGRPEHPFATVAPPGQVEREAEAFREQQAKGFRIGLRNRADDLFGPPIVNRAIEEMSRGERVSNITLGMVIEAGGARGLPEDAAVSIFLYLVSAGEIMPEDPSMLSALEPFG